MKPFESYSEFLERKYGISEREFEPSEFPEKLPKGQEEEFLVKGVRDGSSKDDKIKTQAVRIPAGELNPSQEAIFLGKSLGMAVGGVAGGDLDAIISMDNYILDGHHRWAATVFNDPSVKVGGVQVALEIHQLIPVLRLVGDAMGNERRGNPGGNDKNIFDATMQDVTSALTEGEYMNPEFYDAEKSKEWYEEKGRALLEERLKLIQSKKPGQEAPPRSKMPVINPDELKRVQDLMKQGKIDVFEPYGEL